MCIFTVSTTMFYNFKRYGEIVDIHLVRDKSTGRSKGFAFICYEDQRSTILAVDNFNGAQVQFPFYNIISCSCVVGHFE